MSISCLAKCNPGDKVTICYVTRTGPRMARGFTPFQREFTVIKMVQYDSGGYHQLMVPLVGSDSEIDGMHSTRRSSIKQEFEFDYEWVVHPSYNHIVRIRKKQK